ncbi:HTH-type transcriptional regulator, rpiR family [Phaeobacter inhibens]|uniref:HTH-type transcriptional regulator, rpiR family n=1 Tax=Phaeobacter inhibens TaxID=221822 RepID=A0ABM6R9Q2_9RHOB|nr:MULTISPECIES: MurR/RpiR family transcriptional regulator [Phaeobacter]AUQ48591.1 HTH-type transcriptional regulator, rpiR family [Phaeobacter inhibens]AUQ55639.1 HTH-type transcriptional regulator, rpiR family [Phaeobacter inhibens]AUQ71813.1 HTH-type transcriptional regulator, rpiR family [Phaeobacter inhibens]AUQ79655.1 HTH-type transcriptional regulator, rpiR family [Phaeobacter inhibens]AUQ93091.1 HTH-type transcriptional regulator, rpiR family [Phaeobacter inhibens]
MQVRERIEKLSEDLTATERKLSTALLLDYPFAGLEPIQDLAKATNTSPPSISRFVTKLGFQGFQEFQRHLIGELKQGQRSPVELQASSAPIHGAFLESFLDRASAVVKGATKAVSEAQFERVSEKLADEKRSIYVIGGRMSDTLAQHLSRHLRQIRAKVFHLPSDPEVWPEYLLRMRARDILFIVDFRRYQNSLSIFAQKAIMARNVQVVLMTDAWLSPISAQASEVLAVPIDSGTLWDSYTGALALLEALLTRIAEENWEQTKGRIEEWDSVRLDFGETEDDQ